MIECNSGEMYLLYVALCQLLLVLKKDYLFYYWEYIFLRWNVKSYLVSVLLPSFYQQSKAILVIREQKSIRVEAVRQIGVETIDNKTYLGTQKIWEARLEILRSILPKIYYKNIAILFSNQNEIKLYSSYHSLNS